ncbi:hypothetical protein P4U44_07690 [Alkalihalobacillus alcalophilus]|uniref:hypothetical protein n=1 Tax=Alkalihalobacillus alcalophilus TaxID=1445 RepID=UPI0010A62BA0|nr:hypothetical protein [Alkalihalobacillus alcalophilus]MED1561797.1 hypothetical protein [Alkalihalobacillus alcalophilus]
MIFNQRALNLTKLENMLRTESPDVLTLDYLSTRTDNLEAKELWRILVSSRRQHYEWLKTFFINVSGRLPAVDQNTFVRPSSYESGLNEQINEYQERLRALNQLLNEASNQYESEYLRVVIYYFEQEGILLTQLSQMRSERG